jgi:hypothetical protein
MSPACVTWLAASFSPSPPLYGREVVFLSKTSASLLEREPVLHLLSAACQTIAGKVDMVPFTVHPVRLDEYLLELSLGTLVSLMMGAGNLASERILDLIGRNGVGDSVEQEMSWRSVTVSIWSLLVKIMVL